MNKLKKKLANAVAFQIHRIVSWATFGTRYKKFWLDVRQCPELDVHAPHAWHPNHRGYVKYVEGTTSRTIYGCEGVLYAEVKASENTVANREARTESA